jgi:alpha-L-arabinofuranosidase
MSSYAPLLAKDGHTQWNPNLIYFDNKEVKPTVGYYVQKMFGQNAGDQYLPASTVLSNNEDGVKKRIAISVVRDSKSNDLIVKLVNMLPVNVNAQVDLTGLVSPGSTAKKIELQGDPADKNAKPQESSITITDKSTLPLNPYSVTVIRLAANRK